MFQVAAIYFVIFSITSGEKGAKTAWIALICELIAIFGGTVSASFSKMLQTHAGYFMAADRRISIANRLKSVPMGFFNDNSLGQICGVCTTVVGSIESMVPMALVNILGGLITTFVFAVLILIFNLYVGLIVIAGILLYLVAVSAMEKKSRLIADNTQKSQTALIEAILETVQGMDVSMLQLSAAAIDRTTATENMPHMDENGRKLNPQSYDIVFQNVNFSYEQKPILHDICAVLPDKTTTAVIGQSGSGKTTFCNLIARFWDTDSESIKIGGYDVKDYTLESLMDQISVVFQNVYLFADTIENNIKFGRPNATHDEVAVSAKAACSDDFIERLPDGYNTVIGEGGASLSGGEKQHISIARAMLKNAPIVILDKATANVDPENEDRLPRAIETLTHDKTIIMIAHRLKTMRSADQILVIDHGKIVQKGKHDQLVSQPGIYADFVGKKKQAVDWKL